MNQIELHILQSYPVSCLNRDEVGTPKSAIFGGSNRARLSSQCMKRAIREHAERILPLHFQGNRTRREIPLVARALAAPPHNLPESEAAMLATALCCFLLDKTGSASASYAKDGVIETPGLLFLTPRQRSRFVEAIAERRTALITELSNSDKSKEDVGAANSVAEDPKDKKGKKAKAAKSKKTGLESLRDEISDLLRAEGCSDGADVALFGRMVANDSSLNIEAASMFGHAISTHRCDGESDFFTAVDDEKKRAGVETDTGSGHMGNNDFNSACYYRYCALNLDELAKASHLGGLDQAARASVVDAFIRSAIQAVPGARKHTQNAHTLPGYVLGIRKTKGHPLQLVNAFEKPVPPSADGFLEPSIVRLHKHHDDLKKTWGLSYDKEVELVGGNISFDEFIKQLLINIP